MFLKGSFGRVIGGIIRKKSEDSFLCLAGGENGFCDLEQLLKLQDIAVFRQQ